MSKGTIHLHDVLQQMNARDENGNQFPFQIKFFTYNRTKQTGGELIEMTDCVAVVGNVKGKTIEVPQVKSNLDMERTSRNPNHYINGTMNIKSNVSKQIRTIHTRLIAEFNHQNVTW